MKPLGTILGTMVGFLCSGPLSADTVTLLNGDQLSGQVLAEEHDSVLFQSTLLPEPLEIPLDSISEIQGLEDVSGPEQPEAETLPDPSPQPPAEEISAPQPPPESPAPEDSAPESSLFELPENWNATIGLGYNDSQNEAADTQEISAEGALRWEGERHEAEWRGFYRYQSQEDEKSADRYAVSQRLRRRGDKGFYAQVKTKAEVDNLTKNRTQISQTAGLGYAPIKEEKLAVNITPGVKAEHIAQAESEDDLGTVYKAHVDQELTWNVNETVSLGQALTYSVDPRQTENWDMDFNAFVETQVSEDVNLRVNYRRDFLNRAQGADDKKSAELGAALVWDF